MLVEQQSEVLSVVRADEEEQSWTLAGPEAQGDVFCSQSHVGVNGGRQSTAALVQHQLLEGVADGCSRL